ncbi:MAG: ADP-forming succinate--CoA ligase subunit beta [Halanaeroarchaeum sp.]
MRLHEYQAKEVFADAGIETPESVVATSVEEVLRAGWKIGYPIVLKAQVHVGGRGKAGGIKLAVDEVEAAEAARDILDTELKGYNVRKLLVEDAVDFQNELYVGVTLDRNEDKPVAIASEKGGVDIEGVADETPEAISRIHVDPSFGMHPYQAREVVYDADIPEEKALGVADILHTLYDIWTETDATETEVNPLVIDEEGELIALDGVLNVDENALYRQPELAELEEESYEDELERKAIEYDFDYVRLDGNVGVIGNGAGLVMTTLDMVEYYGGKPANFLDVGGGAKADRIADALDIVFSDPNIDAILFNIFGGITRGDEAAKGINGALEKFDTIPKPIVVRLTGLNADLGREILDTERLTMEDTLEDAVERVVAICEEGQA